MPLSHLPSGTPLPPPFWRRWSSTTRDRVIGWGGGVLLMLIAFGLRVYHLGSPKKFQFDETYYAKDAWAMLTFGYSRNYAQDADTINPQILGGTTTGLWRDGPSMTVHPEVGKWIIAAGEKAFGMDPFGWRIASAVVGSLMILLMVRFVRRVSGSTFIGLAGGVLLAFDGMHLVLSRLALLDIFLAFFLLAAVHCVVADRQWFRARLGDAQVTGTGWGPRVWFRPWLLGAGLMFGLAAGTKWTALYPLAAFGLLVWAWSAGARKSRGVRWSLVKSGVIDGIPAFLHVVAVAFVVYVSTWAGWLTHAHEYEEHLSNNTYTQQAGREAWPSATESDAEGLGEVTQSLRSLWHYHQDVWEFHRNGLQESTHTYGSHPGTWLLLGRPVGVDAQLDLPRTTEGCPASVGDTCMRQVLLLGNPLIWWGCAVALVAAVALWLGARDWRFGVAVVGVGSTWLPWIAESMRNDRPIFIFYMSAALPFMILALCLVFGRLLGPTTQPSTRRSVAVVAGGTFMVLVLLCFAWFWPIWTDQLISHDAWLQRIWFQRWI